MRAVIRKAAVVGAGTMGSGIAAQFANGGVPVVLLDKPGLAAAAIQRQLKAGGFMHPDAAKLVTPGDVEADMGLIADADWIVEAVVENLEVKRALFVRVEAARKDGSLVSSNTSSLRLEDITQGLGERFAGDFVVTHFFNPPRHMRLVEVVAGPQTRPDSAARVRRAADLHLGKAVVDCRDTPGFIANRIGCYWMTVACMEAFALGLTVEEADAVAGAPFGIPRTGIFGLLDLVGIDLVPPVWGSLLAGLPEGDDHHRYPITEQPLIRRMIAEGYTGRKGKGGFYRVVKNGRDKRREAIDLASGEYRPERPATLPAKDLKDLVARDDAVGRYAWRVLANTLTYALETAADIADDVAAVDTAMELGYNWSQGLFALADRLGCAWLAERLEADGRAVPTLLRQAIEAGGFRRVADGRHEVMATAGGFVALKRPEGVLSLADVKLRSSPLLGNTSASLWDIGDGVACLELHTKLNTIDPGVVEMIENVAAGLPPGFTALVVGNEDARAFSAGANLAHVAEILRTEGAEAMDAFIARSQAAIRALSTAPFPVVGAAHGLAFGGGCEILLACDAVQAHAEVSIGLVEAKVGIIPGWGGCTGLLRRWAEKPGQPKGPLPASAGAFEVIAGAKVSGSALEARDMGFLRSTDGVTMNRERLLADAKDRVLALADGYAPPQSSPLSLAGASGRASLMNTVAAWKRLGWVTPHDELVLDQLARVLTGGDTHPAMTVEDEVLLRLEREALTVLVRHPATRARIEHMMATGKPLRN
jgi:3-hydroxyacyl-CoA dehydrogenase